MAGDPAGPPVGSHVDVAGALASDGLAYVDGVGAEAIQVFVSNPRAWSPPAEENEAQVLARRAAQAGLPVFVHAPYLVNLGSGDERTAALSAETVGLTLDRAARIGARGVVVHAGSASGWDRESALRQVADLLLPLLDKLGDDDPGLLIEPMAGAGQGLCAQMSDLDPYLEALERHPRAAFAWTPATRLRPGTTWPRRAASTLPWPSWSGRPIPAGCSWCTRTTPATRAGPGATGTRLSALGSSGSSRSGPCCIIRCWRRHRSWSRPRRPGRPVTWPH